MKILESKFVQGFIKMADDGYQQGWHERTTERPRRVDPYWC